jgi:Tfp pilus assembly protein PilO
MKQFNKITHLLVLLYFAVSLVIFLSFNSVKGIFGIEELNTSLVVNFLLIGLVLFLISMATEKMEINGLLSQIEKKEIEKNELKAKLYDQEQGIKLKNIEQKMAQKEEERDSSVIRPRQNIK